MLFPASDPHAPRTPNAPVDDGAPVKPIGPERLRQLREAILAGTYPLDAAAHSGLTSILTGGAAGSGRPAGAGASRSAEPKKPADPR